MTPELRDACRKAVHVIRPDGTVLAAGRASLHVLGGVGGIGWRWTARVLSVPPFVWAVEMGYRLVAKNRPFFSRFLFRR